MREGGLASNTINKCPEIGEESPTHTSRVMTDYPKG